MEVTGISAPTVTVFISSSLNSFRSEKRYSRSLTIAELKVWPWRRGPEGRGKEKGVGAENEWAELEVRVRRAATSLRGRGAPETGVQRVGAGPGKIRLSREPRGRVQKELVQGGSFGTEDEASDSLGT